MMKMMRMTNAMKVQGLRIHRWVESKDLPPKNNVGYELPAVI